MEKLTRICDNFDKKWFRLSIIIFFYQRVKDVPCQTKSE